MSHNCAERQLDTAETVGAELVGPQGFRLTGTQAKTKRCIEINVQKLASEVGIGRLGFMTLTVGDWCDQDARFVQTWDLEEANRRVHRIARRFLPSLFRRWIIITERHASGAVHFHLVVEMPFECREGYDWEAVRNGDYSSASAPLRALWELLRCELPKFGFGRAQVEPAKGEGSLACYVAKYVEKNLFNRRKEDKGARLVRYGGWKKGHTRPCDICWATEGACKWRIEAQAMALIAKGFTTRAQVAESLGPKWAHRITQHFGFSLFDQAHVRELWRRMERDKNRSVARRVFMPDRWERPLTDMETLELNRELSQLKEEAEIAFNW